MILAPLVALKNPFVLSLFVITTGFKILNPLPSKVPTNGASREPIPLNSTPVISISDIKRKLANNLSLTSNKSCTVLISKTYDCPINLMSKELVSDVFTPAISTSGVIETVADDSPSIISPVKSK